MDCLTVIFFSINQHNHCTASSSKPSVYTTSYIVCSMILINFRDSNSKVRLISLSYLSLPLPLSPLPFPISLLPPPPVCFCRTVTVRHTVWSSVVISLGPAPGPPYTALPPSVHWLRHLSGDEWGDQGPQDYMGRWRHTKEWHRQQRH